MKDMLENALVLVFQNIDYLDLELLDRYAEFMSFYVTHQEFNFGGHQKMLEAVKDLPEEHPKVYALKLYFEKLVELNFLDAIKKKLPEDMIPYLPTKMQEAVFKYCD